MGGSRSHPDFLGAESSQNCSKPVQIFWSNTQYHMHYVCISLLKVVSYNDLSVLSMWQENTNIVIDNINDERVLSFQYLGSMFITHGDGASNIKQRLAMAVQALNNMQY